MAHGLEMAHKRKNVCQEHFASGHMRINGTSYELINSWAGC